MDWRDWAIGIFSTAFLGVAATSLKLLWDINVKMASMVEWRKGMDKFKRDVEEGHFHPARHAVHSRS